jgi:hypothetical protein
MTVVNMDFVVLLSEFRKKYIMCFFGVDPMVSVVEACTSKWWVGIVRSLCSISGNEPLKVWGPHWRASGAK